jgi:hypothetical protein
MVEASLRSLSVGSDTENYYGMFSRAQNMSWAEVWREFLDRYVNSSSEEDAGYTVLQKLVSIFTTSWPLFVIVAQLIFFIPLSKLLYKYSTSMRQLIFAYILYVALFHIIALSGGRQLYAIGMTIFSLLYLVKKRYVPAIICIVIGAFLHLSCLLFLLPILLSRFNSKILKKIHLVSLLLVPLIIYTVNPIILFMGSFLGSEKYSQYGKEEVAGGATTFIILMIVCSIYCYVVFTEKHLECHRFLFILYAMVPLFTLFSPLIYSNGSMIRVSMYFHLYLMLLLPFALDSTFKGKSRPMVYFIAIALLLFLSLRDGGLLYHFYWQEPQINKFFNPTIY